MRVTRFHFFAFIAAAMVLRVALALSYGNDIAGRSGAVDEVSYDMLAQRLATGHGFTFPRPWYPFTAANEPTAHWSYLYTLLLAALYTLLGHSPLAARLLQVGLSAVALRQTYRLGLLLFDRRVALVAAALASAYAYFVFFSAVLMTQTCFIVALLVAMEQALLLARGGRAVGWIALGAALGVGVLFRQTLLLFAPFLLLWCAWRRADRRAWRGALAAAACIAALILPWTVYNFAVFGDFLLLNSNGGFFLYASNHPDQGVDFDPNFVPRIPADIRALGEPAADRALMRGAVEFVRADPVRFLRLSFSRLGDYFWALPSARSSLPSNLGRLASFTLYLPFILVGLWLSRRNWRDCFPLYAYLAFEAALHLSSWAAPRYRLPSDALAMVFAALGALAAATRLGWRVDVAAERCGGAGAPAQ
jgi:4-amino-4-deoxy-L-arabinose transferase-like glycosyltransferase